MLCVSNCRKSPETTGLFLHYKPEKELITLTIPQYFQTNPQFANVE